MLLVEETLEQIAHQSGERKENNHEETNIFNPPVPYRFGSCRRFHERWHLELDGNSEESLDGRGCCDDLGSRWAFVLTVGVCRASGVGAGRHRRVSICEIQADFRVVRSHRSSWGRPGDEPALEPGLRSNSLRAWRNDHPDFVLCDCVDLDEEICPTGYGRKDRRQLQVDWVPFLDQRLLVPVWRDREAASQSI